MTERLSVEQIEHGGLIRRIRERAINQRLCNVADADNWDEAADAITALRAEVEELKRQTPQWQGLATVNKREAEAQFERAVALRAEMAEKDAKIALAQKLLYAARDREVEYETRATIAEAALAARPDDGLVERLKHIAGKLGEHHDAADWAVTVREAAATLKGRQA